MVELVERYLIPEGRLAPVAIYTGYTDKTCVGWLSLYQYKRKEVKAKKARTGEAGTSAAAAAATEEDESGPGFVPSGYSLITVPIGSKARKELQTFKEAFIQYSKKQGGVASVGEQKVILPKPPAGDQVNLAHIVWRYFHRINSDMPLAISPERYREIVCNPRLSDQAAWDALSVPDEDGCRRLPLGLQISHQGEAYDMYVWDKERDIHPAYKEVYAFTAKRKGAKGAKEIVWGSDPGYKIEVSEAEDLVQQGMRQSCAGMGLMWRSAKTGQLLSQEEWGSGEPIMCPHAVHGFPCYGPKPTLEESAEWPPRDSQQNKTTRSQLTGKAASAFGFFAAKQRKSAKQAAAPPPGAVE